MSDLVAVDFNRGQIAVETDVLTLQERLERDFDLTQRIQADYFPPVATDDNPRPRIVDGNLNPDGQAAIAELWSAYENLAKKIANKHLPVNQDNPVVDFDDLVQQGFLGLYHSALRWHPDQNIVFTTHVYSSMENYMIDFADSSATTIYLPYDQRAAIRKLNNVVWDHYSSTQKMPTLDSIASKMEIEVDEVRQLLMTEAMSYQMGSLEGGYFEDARDRHSIGVKHEFSAWNPIPPKATRPKTVEEQALQHDFQNTVIDMIRHAGFPEVTVTILGHRYLSSNPLDYKTLSRLTGLTYSEVKEIDDKAMARLRHQSLSQPLQDYRFDS